MLAPCVHRSILGSAGKGQDSGQGFRWLADWDPRHSSSRTTVDPEAGTATLRTYADSLNPPILHRKELLLPADHPRRAEYAALTEACEAIGLFDEPTRIGYRRQWLDLVREKGYRLAGHALVPLGNTEGDGDAGDEPQDAVLFGHWQAARQLTALVRYGFSAPVQSLARYGFLDGGHRVFDYGCGRGDDLRGLAENGLEAAGWDPFYAPDRPLAPADIVKSSTSSRTRRSA